MPKQNGLTKEERHMIEKSKLERKRAVQAAKRYLRSVEPRRRWHRIIFGGLIAIGIGAGFYVLLRRFA